MEMLLKSCLVTTGGGKQLTDDSTVHHDWYYPLSAQTCHCMTSTACKLTHSRRIPLRTGGRAVLTIHRISISLSANLHMPLLLRKYDLQTPFRTASWITRTTNRSQNMPDANLTCSSKQIQKLQYSSKWWKERTSFSSRLFMAASASSLLSLNFSSAANISSSVPVPPAPGQYQRGTEIYHSYNSTELKKP